MRVFGIAELRLEIIQLADGLVVQIALAVTLQERHCQLVHRIVGPFLPSADPCLQEVDQPGGGHVGPFVKAFYPIAFHLEAEVSLLHRVAELVVPARGSVLLHDFSESIGLGHNQVVELAHPASDIAGFGCHTLHEVGPRLLIVPAPFVCGLALLGPLLLEQLFQLVGGHVFQFVFHSDID